MKIAHISDLHFGMHQPQIVDAFLKDAMTLQPQLIIISGDLTQRAKNYQFELLQSFLEELPGTILVVPGNHDVPLYNVLARLINPFKAYNHYVKEQFKAEFVNEEVAILGANSVNPFKVKEGRLTPEALEIINNFFTVEGKSLNILFFHHNFDHIVGLHKPLENEEQFLKYLKESNIDIVCTGHLHYANVGLIKKNNGKTCLVLHAGTLLCSRRKDEMNSYFMMHVNAEECSIDWRVFKNNQFELHKNYTMKLSQEVKLE
ncbi:metallophosphoesterase family protein [Legionella clemsonensis]|uniref:Calcineurin-like phosphoesterase superfamily domain protein n=1 Tax=Legionella clemsonensis TaxID=1867846 RepID=A0A222P167_9GAMM|nr:metallophosphoesterase [Legionella clemsonensis]ASQ45576.1 Calcineurin-like phosphoesterase superfamily domain protein [Legionella clemsonensis]